MESLMQVVRMFTELGERQGPVATRAGKRIMAKLSARAIPYRVERLTTYIPRGTSKLVAGGVRIESAPCSMTSGVITNADGLSSSLIPSRYVRDVSTINFNPSSRGLSVSNLYFAPSLVIRVQDVPQVLKAKKIHGEIKVRKTRVVVPQILVGNLTNPETLVFCHYDSIGGPGAIDNASGAAICLALCIREPELLESTLFIFDPNEEVSYDYPTYWGHGYRTFAKKYARLMRKAKRILVIDSVGNGKPEPERSPRIINLAFPVPEVGKLSADIVALGGDIEAMMKVYQSELDTEDLLSEEHLEETYQAALKLIKSSR